MMMAATHRAYWWTSVAVLCPFAGAASGTPLNLTVLSWNVHWQCGSDHIPRCRSAATSKIIELAAKHAANVIVAVELEHNDTAPIDLPSHGLPTAYPRWAQVNGTCPGAPGKTGDALALVLGSDWELQQVYRNGKYEALADGGCLGGDAGGVYKADARAFAVALAKPPQPGVKGCEKGVCLIGLHSPHIDITKGADKVAAVCGEARHKCTVAVGDWNAPFSKQPFCNYTVQDRWGQLLGAASQTAKLVAAPDENTCCFPESKYLGWDDHAVTNIAGATVSATALPYQMGGAGGFGKDTEEHKPIVATVQLPTAAASGTIASTNDTSVSSLNTSGGSLLWNHTRNDEAMSGDTPTLSLDGQAIYLCPADIVYALKASDGSLLWKHEGGLGSFVPGPTLSPDGQALYVGADDNSVYAINASDGSFLWTYTEAPGDVEVVHSTPTLSPDGQALYIGSQDNSISAIKASNGSLLWQYTAGPGGKAIPGREYSTPTLSLDGRVVYVGADDTTIHAIKASDGSLLWKISSGDEVDSNPPMLSWDGQALYVRGNHYDDINSLIAIKASDGSLLWTYTTGSAKYEVVYSTPTLSRDGRVLYVVSLRDEQDSSVYALSTVSSLPLHSTIDKTQIVI